MEKKETQASIRCLTMLLRCLHNSSTYPLELMMAALRFTTVELRMLTIRYGASTIQASSATVVSRPPTNVHDLVVVMQQSLVEWGGGVLLFFSYVGSGPASTVHPPKHIRNFKHPPPPPPPKKMEILATKKIFPILYLDIIKKTLKCIEMTPKYSPILC